jgi:hypothetical protein
MTIVKAAATTAWAFEFDVRVHPKKFTGFGFSGSDAVTLQEQGATDNAWQDHIDGTTGLPVTLSADCTGLIIKGPGAYRWNKGATTGSVGLRAFNLDKI